MKFSQVGIVYRKELLDMLRDHRTLISMIVVPLLLFPLLTIGFVALAANLVRKARQEVSSIMIVGAEHAPTLAATIRKQDVFEVVASAEDYQARINDKKLRVAIKFPPHFEEALQANVGLPDSGERPTVKLYYYTGEMRSQFALRDLKRILRVYRNQLVEARLAGRGLSPDLLEPFESQEENVASPEKMGSSVLGGLLPFFIILLCFTGAMYPAIDLSAGEKERGTIETILASPVGRTEVVMGKFLMTLTASLTTAVLSLGSFAVTLPAAAEFTQQMSRAGLPFVVSAKGMAMVLLLVLPLAVLFSAALLALALLARSYKEGQSYMQPLMIAVILPAIAAMLPGVELNAKLALIPILNVSLISKEILTGNYPWDMIGLIFASTCVYAGVALFVAVRQFQRESVLFRT